jgi:hypothetical protein
MEGSNFDERYVLKDNFTLNNQDYNKLKQAQQYNKLYSQQYSENERLKTLKENKNIYNLSIHILLKNLSQVLMDIINEVSVYISKKNKNINELMTIFVKKERLMYVGIFLICLSLALWFIDISK